MAMEEEDGGHSSAPRLLFRSALPALVTGALPDDHGSDRARRVGFPVRTAFFLTSGIMLVLGLLVKCDGIGFVCFVIGWFALLVCSCGIGILANSSARRWGYRITPGGDRMRIHMLGIGPVFWPRNEMWSSGSGFPLSTSGPKHNRKDSGSEQTLIMVKRLHQC